MNTDEENKCIYIAESGLYELIKIEKPLMAFALGIDVAKSEQQFNDMIEAALSNYNDFEANVYNKADPFELEILSNFAEMMEWVLDIKKHEMETAKKMDASKAMEPPKAIEPSKTGVSTIQDGSKKPRK